MDIGIVTPRYPPNVAGGGEISVSLLAEHLQRSPRIDSLTVLSFDGKTTETRNGVQIHRLANVSSYLTEWQNIRALIKLRKHIDPFDVIHAYNMELHPVVGAIGERRELATVATLNSYHFVPKSAANVSPDPLDKLYEIVGYPTTGRILRKYMKQIDRFIALSTAIKTIYANHGFGAENITVIPNIMDSSFTVPERESSDSYTVLFVGPLSKIKGVEYLIRAFNHLPDDYELRIVGDGPRAEDLQNLAREMGYSDRISFVGYVDYESIPEQYAKADLFVHPGVLPEPFNRTLLEAMQAGLPVVATDIGAAVDVVRRPELRCPPRDPQALATAIGRARQKGRKIGEENQAFVYEGFSPSTITSKIVDVYEAVRR